MVSSGSFPNLCTMPYADNFLVLWSYLTVMAFVSVAVMSGTVFYFWFANPNYNSWSRKINPVYPSVMQVRQEIVQTSKSICWSTLMAALSLHFASMKWSKAYCGVEPYGWGYMFITAGVCFIATDFFEWGYHALGHRYKMMWDVHKHHHLFHNPSPLAVIADEWQDQVIRASPLLIWPMLFPVNMDMLFAMFTVLFYAWGCFLHCGHELNWPDAHHPVLNTSWQHFCHHSKSGKANPYYTGFFLKCWDDWSGQVYDKECFCIKCQKANGERTYEQWEKVKKVDYSDLLSFRFWLTGKEKQAQE